MLPPLTPFELAELTRWARAVAAFGDSDQSRRFADAMARFLAAHTVAARAIARSSARFVFNAALHNDKDRTGGMGKVLVTPSNLSQFETVPRKTTGLGLPDVAVQHAR